MLATGLVREGAVEQAAVDVDRGKALVGWVQAMGMEWTGGKILAR
jgi:hypothetical protein